VKCGLVFVIAIVLAAPAYAYHLPVREGGLGAATLYVPAYRGAKDQKFFWLPVPYLAYRGDTVKIDEEGVRGELYQGPRVQLDFSLAGNVPVSGDKHSARAGMRDLDPVGEAGPAMNVFLFQAENSPEHQFWLRLPLRAVVSVGEPLLDDQGWVFSPYLDWVWRRTNGNGYWRTSLAAGPMFASRRYHNYFYEVTAEDVTAARNEYHPGSGYSGSRATFTFTLNTRRWFIGAFARYDDLRGAEFVESPLVETDRYFALGVAVMKIFSRSEAKAPH
jgi:outer membrane scaffolding protein for murein synthesis (MipA/OmpV family)